MKKTTKKLQLKAETVRVLTNSELAGVVGGTLTTAINCTNNCQPRRETAWCTRHHTKHLCVATTAINCPR